MRRIGAAAIATIMVGAASVALLGAGSAATAERTPDVFEARLGGFNEVPAISTTGTGMFRARVDVEAQEISYMLTYSGLESTAVASHIHLGQARVNGGVIAFLCGGGDKPACPTEGTVTGTIDTVDVIGPDAQGIEAGAFAEVLHAMRKGVTYVNVHSQRFPGGEIRGQMHAVSRR